MAGFLFKGETMELDPNQIGWEEYRSYEVTLCVRDKDGKPTDQTKTLRTNNPEELSNFWLLHQQNPKRKPKQINQSKKKKKNFRGKEVLPNAKQADSILANLYGDNAANV